jgi:tetratricopeptide (TPR) repeat protein
MAFLRSLFGKKQPGNTSSAIADDDTVFLQAEPISRKQMILLWLDLDSLQLALVQNPSLYIQVSDADSDRGYHEITQVDIEWAKPIISVVDKADSANQRGNCKEAIQHYKKALKLVPGCDLLLMSIGSCYFNLGEKAKAIQYLERAAQISPGNSRICNNLNTVRG